MQGQQSYSEYVLVRPEYMDKYIERRVLCIYDICRGILICTFALLAYTKL